MPARLKIIDFFKTLKDLPLRLMLELAGFAWDTPDINDSKAVRQWLRELCVTLGKFAKLSETDLDDMTIDKVAEIIENDEAWEALYAIVMSILDREEPVIPDSQDPQIVGVAKTVGFDPATIIAIITTIIQLIEWFRDRKDS